MMSARKSFGKQDSGFDLGVEQDGSVTQDGSVAAGPCWDWGVAEETAHDARGLVIAILACVVCWAALGYFLLK